MDLIGLAVPFAVQHRDHVEPAPHLRADVGADEAQFLGQLAPQRVERVFVRLDAATRQGPHHGRREVESGEQHAIGRVEEQGAHGPAYPQVGPRRGRSNVRLGIRRRVGQ